MTLIAFFAKCSFWSYHWWFHLIVTLSYVCLTNEEPGCPDNVGCAVQDAGQITYFSGPSSGHFNKWKNTSSIKGGNINQNWKIGFEAFENKYSFQDLYIDESSSCVYYISIKSATIHRRYPEIHDCSCRVTVGTASCWCLIHRVIPVPTSWVAAAGCPSYGHLHFPYSQIPGMFLLGSWYHRSIYFRLSSW